MQNDSEELSFCLSFNSYSGDKVVDIAGAVVGRHLETGGDVSKKEEFEFFNLSQNTEASAFPIFDRNLLLDGDEKEVVEDKANDNGVEENIPVSLAHLYIADGDIPYSSASSEVDELEGLTAGTYCVWTPNRCKKSNSMGSRESKRWRLKDLLKRSYSDSKISSSSPSPSLSFLVPKINEKTETAKKKNEDEENAMTIKKVEKAPAHVAFYVRNKALKEGDKRRSYLPYRQDLVGIFSNGNGLGKNVTFPPF